MTNTLLEARDTLDQARILVHAIFMASDALDPQDGNAISTVAELARERLNEVQRHLAQMQTEKIEGAATCASST